MTKHKAILIKKRASSYKLDNGVQIPAHDLHRYKCSCGWEGAAFYAESTKALAHWDNHRELIERVGRP